jgi:hypothetical protein
VGRIDWDVDEQVAAAARACVAGVTETLELARTYAVGVTPVDIGWLRAGWAVSDVEIHNLTHVVGTLYNPVEYAGFVNDGTSRMQGRHMLEQAVDAVFPTVGARIQRRMQ